MFFVSFFQFSALLHCTDNSLNRHYPGPQQIPHVFCVGLAARVGLGHRPATPHGPFSINPVPDAICRLRGTALTVSWTSGLWRKTSLTWHK
jgi:hypothetical protein